MRPCSEQESLAVLQLPSVASHLINFPESVRGLQTYIVNDSFFLGVASHGSIAEVHVGIPFRARAAVRDALHMIIGLLRGAGFKGVFTTASDERRGLERMLENLGFQKMANRWVKLWD